MPLVCDRRVLLYRYENGVVYFFRQRLLNCFFTSVIGEMVISVIH